MALLLFVSLLCFCPGLLGDRRIQKRAIQSVVPLQDVQKLHNVAEQRSNMTHFMSSELDPFLIERVSGTPGNALVRKHIISQLRGLSAGWDIELDDFTDRTPFGQKSFSNVVATLSPRARRRLVLACHYDSKYYRDMTFIGAIDSAVPCAMLINMARVLDRELRSRHSRLDTTLQLIFFDGEEAFVKWTDQDSLYGSRHLAAKMERSRHPHHPDISQLQAMDAFVLLDLIGSRDPNFYNYFPTATGPLFRALQSIESRLHENGLLKQHRANAYFTNSPARGHIGDDHVPFMNRGVPIVHVIAYKFHFPPVWHSAQDTKENLDIGTIDNLNRIFRVFVMEYLDMDVLAQAAGAPTPSAEAGATSGAGSTVDVSTAMVVASAAYAGVSTLRSLIGTSSRRGQPLVGTVTSPEGPVEFGSSSSIQTAAVPVLGNADPPPPLRDNSRDSGHVDARKVAAAAIVLSIVVTVASLFVRAGAHV